MVTCIFYMMERLKAFMPSSFTSWQHRPGPWPSCTSAWQVLKSCIVFSIVTLQPSLFRDNGGVQGSAFGVRLDREPLVELILVSRPFFLKGSSSVPFPLSFGCLVWIRGGTSYTSIKDKALAILLRWPDGFVANKQKFRRHD